MNKHILTVEIIERFRKHLILEEKSQNTIKKYIRDVVAFAAYLGERYISKEIIIAYKQELFFKGYAITSINSIIASLNSLFTYLDRVDCKLKLITIQKQAFCSEKKELTREEYLRLISAAKSIGNERLNLLIQTICSTGIRVSELQFITVEAVKKGETTVFLKGKTRVIFIVKDLQKKLLHYIVKQKIKDGSVFITRTGKPMSRTNIWREMKNLCEKANVNPSKVFPHNLRHLFARTFYGMRKDIVRLADVLGHTSINTTRIYTTTTSNEHRMFIENMRLVI